MRTVPLDDDVTLAELRRRLVDVGSELLVDALAGGLAGLPEPVPQQGEVTIAEKITKEDLHLDWAAARRAAHAGGPARPGLDHVPGHAAQRAARRQPATPGRRRPARAGLAASAPAVATGAGSLVLDRVQPESRSPMSAEEWLRGVRPADGERLGTD